MFGTLFNPKKTDDSLENQVGDSRPTDPVVSGVSVQDQSPDTSKSFIGEPAPESTTPASVDSSVDNSSGVTAPPTPDVTSVNGNQDPIGLSKQADQQVADQNDPNKQNSSADHLDTSSLTHLDPRAAQSLTHATEETKRISQQFIEPMQILFGLLYDEQIYKTLVEAKADGGELSKEIQSKETMGVFRGQPTLSPSSQSVFEQSYKDAKMHGSNFISPEDILLVLFDSQFGVSALLEGRGLKKESLVESVSKNPNLNYGKKTVLEKYGTDLNEQARAGKLDPIAGRDAEIDRMIHIMLRRSKNNPIIIGETGVGKTAIVEGLAQKIVAGQVPKDLQDKRVFQLDVASLIAGASHRGEFEERLRGVLNEVLGSGNKIILFIDEIHSLMGTGEGEGMNAANIIKPHLARGHLQLIGATTTIEYRKNFEKDKAFERRFQPVTAEEPSEENAFEMLKVLRAKYEKFHRVTYPDDTLMECVKLSKKYIGERYLPDKAVDLLDEAGSDVKLQVDEGKRTDTAVKKSDVEKVVSAWTGIPITKLTEDESEKLLKLEDRIHKRLIDQEEAVSAVSEAVRRGRIGLAAANRPIASFVFLGPTGVGKTELAKTMAELLFGRDDAMTRLDMSEYMEKHEVAKLIGAPPGYVGYEEGGQLTEAVRKKPYSIVLLDEIEKAHPDVFNILLQLLEDGRLTDNKGNTISFKNTIVICTSNIGSSVIQEKLSHVDATVKKTAEESDKTFKELTEIVKGELIKFFRPELLNRFDEVVIFKPLLLEHMTGIARLGIGKTAGLLKDQGFSLQVTEKAIEQLAKDGFDPVYGARPLRRLIQTAIENPIALEIISKRFGPGDTIVVDYNQATNEFMFTKGQKVLSESDKFKKLIIEINNAQSITDEEKKAKFIILHDGLLQASADGNTLAKKLLEINLDTNDKDAEMIYKQALDEKEKGTQFIVGIISLLEAGSGKAEDAVLSKENLGIFKKVLQQVVNPLYEAVPENKEKFSKLYEKIQAASLAGNTLAKSMLEISDTSSDNDLNQLLNDLEKGRIENDSFATEVLSVIVDGIKVEADLKQKTDSQASLQAPVSEPVQSAPSQPESIIEAPVAQPTQPAPPSPGSTGAAMQQSAGSLPQETTQSSVGQAPTGPIQPSQVFGASSGMSALNEHLDRNKEDIVNSPVEENGQDVS